MKIFLNTIKQTLAIFLSIFISSCQDFLTESDPVNFAMDNYYKSSEHAESSIIAIYQNLYPIHNDQSWLLLEFTTGIANTNFAGSGGWANNQPVKNLETSSDHPSLTTFWNSHYRGIANANVALLKIPEIPMDEERKKELLGEARFLRAYFYFNLVRMFGEIPVITAPVSLASPDLKPEQSSVSEVYELIVEDLQIAENSGLPLRDLSGRASLGAVKTLLSTVYLTMAGYPLQLGDDYYKRARDKAEEVINTGEFYLFDTYADLHNPDNDNKGEYIFMVQFHETDKPSNALQTGLIPFRGSISKYSNEEGLIFALDEFVLSYDKDDRRVKEREFFFTKFTSESDRTDTMDLGVYCIYKLFDKEAHLSKGRSGLNWQVLRYTDVLLNYAEASNELSGPSEEALQAVNLIRKRAELSDLNGLNKEEFRTEIWMQRWYEHCYEGKLWFDMVRIRKAFNLDSKVFDDFIGHQFAYGPVLTERELLFPIPTDEIRNNPNLTQNFGY